MSAASLVPPCFGVKSSGSAYGVESTSPIQRILDLRHSRRSSLSSSSLAREPGPRGKDCKRRTRARGVQRRGFMSLSKKGGCPWTCRRRIWGRSWRRSGGRPASVYPPAQAPGKRVSARFAGVELEEGLRRLLRLASLSHIFLYANGPGGTVTISEVRVLGEGQDTTPRPATVARAALARKRAKCRHSSPQGPEASPRSRGTGSGANT